MISESVIIFGATGNIIMVINGDLPSGSQIMFKVGASNLDIMSDENLIYTEEGLSAHTCERLRKKNEIGLIESTGNNVPPDQLTNIAYQMA